MKTLLTTVRGHVGGHVRIWQWNRMDLTVFVFFPPLLTVFSILIDGDMTGLCDRAQSDEGSHWALAHQHKTMASILSTWQEVVTEVRESADALLPLPRRL